MIGNYVMIVTVDNDTTLNKTFSEIETALKQGMIVAIFRELASDDGPTTCHMSYITTATRGENSEFFVETNDNMVFKATSVTGYPVLIQ